MRVLHLPYCFYPDPVGGTEVYVDELSRELLSSGIESHIAAPAAAQSRYQHDGLTVHRFAVSTQVDDVEELHGCGSTEATKAFASVLDEARPAIVHFHSFTRATSVLTLAECRRRGIPAVLTYHTPTVTCIRGTLLRWGNEVCDGYLDSRRCSRCALHSKGLPRTLSVLLGGVPPGISRGLRARRSGRLWTAMGMPYLVSARLQATRQFLEEMDAVVAPCDWARELLVRNGVPRDKITFSRHGIRLESREGLRLPAARPGVLRFVFMGRPDPSKGLAVLIEAFRSNPPLRAELTAFVAADPGDRDLKRLASLAHGVPRIQIRSPIWERSALLRELSGYDCLLVPSLSLETGPLVIMEARAAGLPTVGSRLGGVAELIRDGIDGMLVERGSVRAWRSCLERLEGDPAVLGKLRKGVRKPRTMAAVAMEMATVYRRLAP